MSTATAQRNMRILIVDDNQSIHDDFRKSIISDWNVDAAELESTASELFGDAAPMSEPTDDYQIESAYQGQEALQCVQEAVDRSRPFAIAFVDVRMPPGWDGIETIERLWQVDPDLQVVICTAYSDVTAGQIIERLGKSDRLLMLKKPFDPVEPRLLATALTEKWHVTRQVSRQIVGLQEWLVDAERVLDIIQQSHEELENAHGTIKDRASALTKLVQQRTVETAATRDVAVLALAKLAESRDPETGEHLERMREYSQILAEQLAREGPYADQIDERFLEELHRSSPLHDIGKVGIPDEILLKPGPLTDDEFEVMKKHTLIGSDALKDAADQSDYGGFLRQAADIALHHHERFDGTGYPDGLLGREIPLAARIVALADAFDAITSDRVYKQDLAPRVARGLIEDERGKHFDPVIVDAFLGCYDEILQVHLHTAAGCRTI